MVRFGAKKVGASLPFFMADILDVADFFEWALIFSGKTNVKI